MARLDAEFVHSVVIEDGRFNIKVVQGQNVYELSLDPTWGAILVEAMQKAAASLSRDAPRQMLMNVKTTGIEAHDGTRGIEFELSPNLKIPVLLGNDGLAALREGIDRLLQAPKKRWDPLESTCRHASLSIL